MPAKLALRVVALGRKNFLFVGDVEAGDHLATLYSLVSTCEARDIDPVEHLKDVLMRVDTHPASRIDELLPHKWSPPLRWEVAAESRSTDQILRSKVEPFFERPVAVGANITVDVVTEARRTRRLGTTSAHP